jgi:hypothetical protein
MIERRSGRVVSLSDWRAIDGAEIERGSKVGKPREKFTRLDEMISVLQYKEQQDRQDAAPSPQAPETALQN